MYHIQSKKNEPRLHGSLIDQGTNLYRFRFSRLGSSQCNEDLCHKNYLTQPLTVKVSWSSTPVQSGECKVLGKAVKHKKPATEDFLDYAVMDYLPVPDDTATNACFVLRQAIDAPEDQSRREFEVTVSLLAWIDSKKLHSFTRKHEDFAKTEELTTKYLRDGMGVRTCKGVRSALGPGPCSGCKWFEVNTSPYLVSDLDLIETEATGFYEMHETKSGIPRRGKPVYTDLAKVFHREHKYLSEADTGQTWTYNTKHWDEISTPHLRSYAAEKFSPAPNKNQRNEFLDLIKCTHLRKHDWWGHSTRGRINLQNGVYDIDQDKLLEPSPDYGFRYVLPYEYNPDATANVFLRFMQDITCKDTTLEKILLEFMGYSLAGDEYWIHKALMLVGSGSNGKSTLLQVLQNLAGEKNYNASSLGELNDPQYRFNLDGRLFNIAEEAGVETLHKSEVFKRMVGGNEISVKRLYQQPYTIKNRCKLIVSANELPKSGDKTEGLYRRMLIVPFEAVFKGDDIDHGIHAKLKTECSGIFNLAIEAYRRLKANGEFTTSAAHETALLAYKLENDNMLFWVQERIDEFSPTSQKFKDSFESVGKLFTDYKDFTKENLQRPCSKIQFVKRLVKVLPYIRSCREQTILDGRRRGYRGLKLKEEDY